MTEWKYQYRAFTEQGPTGLVDVLDKEKEFSRSSKTTIDQYFVGTSQVSARFRDGQLKLRGPIESVDALVDKLTDERYSFPVSSKIIAEAIGVKKDTMPKQLRSVDELEKWAEKKGAMVADVKKQTRKYDTSTYEVEVTKVDIEGTELWTIAVASNDAPTIHSTLSKYEIPKVSKSKTMDYAQAIRQTAKNGLLTKV